LPRRFTCDLLRVARQLPTVPVERRMNLAAVAAARQAALPRPSWCAVFTKAYALVAAATPELRRAYLSFPWPHLYEHHHNVASIAIERQIGDETAVFGAQVRCPEVRTLSDIDFKVRRFKEQPIERIGAFRRVLRVSRLPRPLRRLLWWAAFNVSGYKRAYYAGTFGVSVYGSMGATALHPLSPLTTTLSTGVLGAGGSLDVRLVYDHRTLDGPAVARALRDLEQVLNSEILTELRYLQQPEAA
jgi:hypothetical protein